MNETFFIELRKRAEKILQERGRKSSEAAGIDLLRLLQELETRHVELELQNKELQRKQEELKVSRSDLSDATEGKCADGALQESERHLRAIFESADEAIITLDENQLCLEANPAAGAITGVPQDQLIGRNLQEFLYPGFDLPSAWEGFLENGKFYGEVQIRHSDGSWRVVDALGVAYVSPDRHLFIGHDVTERKRTEKELRNSKQRLATALEIAELGTWEYDAATSLAYFDERGREIFGLTEDRAVSTEALYDLIHREDRDRVREQVRGALDPQGTGLYATEYRILKPDGSISWVMVRGRALQGDETFGKPLRFIGTVMDATERKQAEEALASQKQLLQTVLGTVPTGVVFADDQGNITYFNPSATRLLGGDPTGTAAGPAPDSYKIMKTDGTRFTPDELPLVRAVRESEFVPDIEMVIERADGSRVVLLTNTAPTYDAKGRVTGAVAAMQDITRRKRVEEELRKAHNELELKVQERTAELRRRAEQLAGLSAQLTLAEQRERRRLAVIIHDDLQQLLVGAKIRLEFISKRLGSSDQKDLEQVYSLLLESLKTARSLNAQLVPTVLYERGLAAGLEWLARSMGDVHKVNIETDVDPKVALEREDVKVLLFQSARELLFNAIKHSGSSSISLGMGPDENHNLQITVRDRGIGFDPDSLSKNQDKGLGLYSITERLDLLGGKLEIESSPGKGSVFSLVFPMNKERGGKRPGGISPFSAAFISDEAEQNLGVWKPKRSLEQENAWLRDRLAEAEEILESIRSGGVDALVVSNQAEPRVYTLEGADYIYRVLIENIKDGALILSEEGTILFCNQSFADTVRKPKQKITGGSITDFIGAADKNRFGEIIRSAREKDVSEDMGLKTANGDIRVTVSLKPCLVGDTRALCITVGDLAHREKVEEKPRTEVKKLTSDKQPSEDVVAASLSKEQGVRVLLVDDHSVMRQGLSSMLDKYSDIEVVGEAADGEEAVSKARELRPEVVLMDISMPKMNGIEATRIISSESPDIRIIGLSMYDDDETANAMRNAGAVSFLPKSGHSDALIAAIRNSTGSAPDKE